MVFSQRSIKSQAALSLMPRKQPVLGTKFVGLLASMAGIIAAIGVALVAFMSVGS